MPIYEYQCPVCGEFEVTQRITERPLRRCPTCNGKVTKLISSTSFTLKGSGWYATDYAAKGRGADATSEPKGDAKEAAGGAKESNSPGGVKESNSTDSSKEPSAPKAQPSAP